jgi:hypothetical protein
MGLGRRSNQGFGECQSSSVCRGLQDNVNVLRMAEAVREKYVSGAVGKTQHMISVRAKLF